MIGAVQGERTRQAWTRTSLATLALVLVGLRLAVDRGALAIGVAIVAMLAAGAFALLGRHRAAQLLEPEPPPLPGSVVLAVTAAVVAVDVAGLVLLVS